MNKSIQEQTDKAVRIAGAFGYSSNVNGPDEYSSFIQFSSGVSLCISQPIVKGSLVYTVGYWEDENEDCIGWISEFKDTTDFIVAMQQVLSLPYIWKVYKELNNTILDLKII